jgi:predicted MFS family arabinose efflux permease
VNLWKSLKGLPRDVWALAIATLINRAGMMVLPFLVLYLTERLGFSPSRAGAAFSVYGLGALVAAPLAGRLTDRIGPLPVMRSSLVLSGILLLVFPFFKSFPAVLAVTFIWALVADAFRPASMVFIADVVSAEQLKPAYALNRLAINVGMSIGPAAAGFIATKSFSSIFIADGVTSLVAGIILIMIAFDVLHVPKADEQGLSPLKVLVLDDRRMVLFLAAVVMFGVVFFQMEGPLPLFLVQDLHQSTAFYGALFTLNTVMIVFIEVPLNAATSHWPHSRGLALGAFLFALGSGLFGFATGPLLVLVGMAIWTIGEMLLFPQAAAFVAEIAPQARRGQYMGAYSLALSVAFIIGPWLGTVTYAHLGPGVLWSGVFVAGLISTLMMLRVSVQHRIIPPQVSPSV